MTRSYNVVDADGHILEPLDLWDNYIDPEFRERRPQCRDRLQHGVDPLLHHAEAAGRRQRQFARTSRRKHLARISFVPFRLILVEDDYREAEILLLAVNLALCEDLPNPCTLLGLLVADRASRKNAIFGEQVSERVPFGPVLSVGIHCCGDRSLEFVSLHTPPYRSRSQGSIACAIRALERSSVSSKRKFKFRLVRFQPS